jgi:serine/threonine protein kinase
LEPIDDVLDDLAKERGKKIYPHSCKSTNINKLNLEHYRTIKCKIIHEGYLYKINKTGKRKKFYIILLGKDMFYFKSNGLDELKGIHNLSNCYIHDEIEEVGYNGTPLYAFTLYLNTTKRQFYAKSINDCKVWLDKFRDMLSYRSIHDYYKILEPIGKGSFSKVHHGIDLDTCDSVAIKIIEKDQKSGVLENIRSEIEIMKFCNHDGIIKYIDHFEDLNNIYIVEEYLKGGDLYNYYTTNMKVRTCELKLKRLIQQIGLGLKYLHSYGIIHRDIKLQNILLTDTDDDPIVKIADFGLSKIMGATEKTSDCLGTLNFSAPEVVLRQGYNNKVDIWSLGVLIYFMIFNQLPFNDRERKKQNIVDNICKRELRIDQRSQISQDLYDLLTKCLEKDDEKRIDIEAFLLHKWFS